MMIVFNIAIYPEIKKQIWNELSAVNAICKPLMSLLLILFTLKIFLIKGSFTDNTIAMQFPFTFCNLLKMSPEFTRLNLV